MVKAKPNLFIAGAPRCGTTSLYEYLMVHPEIYGPDTKEPRFLAHEYMDTNPKRMGSITTITDEGSYLSLYEKGRDAKYRMDGTPIYMFYPDVAAKIKDMSDDSHVIISIRNPVDRIISVYNMLWNRGYINVDFEEFFIQSIDEIITNENDFYNLYSNGIMNMYNVLGRDRVHVIKFDDLVIDTPKTLKDIYGFLDVESIVPEFVSRAFNSNKRVLKSNFKRRLITGKMARVIYPMLSKASIRKIKKLIHIGSRYSDVVVDDKLRQKMVDVFMEDIVRTEKLTGFDLSSWKVV